MKVYVASSWRNAGQPGIVHILRRCGIEVYDFRNPHHPARGGGGFAWSEIDPNWKLWTVAEFVEALDNPIAIVGYNYDFHAMNEADACVLVLPCGRSAHLEAGWFIGAGRPCFILSMDGEEPELMYKMATLVTSDIFAIVDALGGKVPES